MRLATILTAAFLAILACSRGASAQPMSLTLNVTPASVSFTFALPTTPATRIDSQPVNVSYTVVKPKKASWRLLISATDFTSGTDTILITNVTWSSAAPFAVAGTLSTANQVLASGTTDATGNGTIMFHLLNQWTYRVGHYTSTVTFTLVSP